MAHAVLDQWLHPGRAALAAIVRQAVAQGEIRSGTGIDVIVDALVSPPYYRLLFALSPLAVDHVARFAKADELVAVLQIAATQVAGLEDVVAAAGAAKTVVMPACLSLSLA